MRPWQHLWPAGLDESRIALPDWPLPFAVKRNAQAQPRNAAIIFYGREVSFAELDDASDRFAGWLRARGLAPGDRVALYLENCPQFAIAYMGSLKAGCVNVCLNPMLKSAELERDLVDSGARALVSSDHGYPAVEPVRERTSLLAVAVTSYRDYLPPAPTLPVPPSFLLPAETFPAPSRSSSVVTESPRIARIEERRPHDTALLQYTSGTTGVPKGAEITHRNIVANCELQRVYVGLRESEWLWRVLPWFHITGMECQLNLSTYMGSTIVALGRFDLEAVLAAIQLYRCTATTLITTINAAIGNFPGTAKYDLTSLRTCCSGGAPVPEAVAERWEAATGYKLIEGYGLSETTAPTHINPPHRPKYGTVGAALPFTDVRIADRGGPHARRAPGEPGEVIVKGPQVMKGYWRQPQATAEALQDGWLATGDIGLLRRRGLPAHRRAQEGPHQGVGLQRVSGGGGGDALPAPRGRGGGRRGRAGRVPRRGGGGVRGAAARRTRASSRPSRSRPGRARRWRSTRRRAGCSSSTRSRARRPARSCGGRCATLSDRDRGLTSAGAVAPYGAAPPRGRHSRCRLPGASCTARGPAVSRRHQPVPASRASSGGRSAPHLLPRRAGRRRVTRVLEREGIGEFATQSFLTSIALRRAAHAARGDGGGRGAAA